MQTRTSGSVTGVSQPSLLLTYLQVAWRCIACFTVSASCSIVRHTFACKQILQGRTHNNTDHLHNTGGSGYGYQGRLGPILKAEFPHLHSKVYADHAGAALYTKGQIDAVKQDLETHLFGNPHSQHGWSGNEGSAQAVADARQLTLQMCNAPLGEYECVFTSGATGALKLVGEAFPWQEGSQFAYTQDNHNSVLGIREVALGLGATATCVAMLPAADGRVGFGAVSKPMHRSSAQDSRLMTQDSPPEARSTLQPFSSSQPDSKPGLDSAHSSSSAAAAHDGSPRASAPTAPCLFAFPLESNFSGTRYDLAVVNQIQTNGVAINVCREEEQQSLLQQHGEAGDWQLQQQPEEAERQLPQQQREAENQHSQQQHGDEVEVWKDQHGEEEDARMLNGRPGQSDGDRWHVLIDAAKACATGPPDLTKHPADFVALSYYKIFGYPTGLGALLVHKRAIPLLMKKQRYFGGGTVAVSLAEEDFFRRRGGAAGLEDGTAHYLGIAAVRHGFHQLAAVGGFQAIAQHTQAVTRFFATQLMALSHVTGESLCVLYGNHDQQAGANADLPGAVGQGPRAAASAPGAVGQGPVVTFNLLRPDGTFFGYREVERLAGLHGILLRTGCFCNPGACARHLGLTSSQLKRNFEAGHVCWDDHDIIDGRPTGAVRVSFGWMSSLEDAQAIITFLQTCFLDTAGQESFPIVSAESQQLSADKQGQQQLRLAAHCSHARPSTAQQGFQAQAATADLGVAAASELSSLSRRDSQQKLPVQLHHLAPQLPEALDDMQSGIKSGSPQNQSNDYTEVKAAAASAWLRQLPWVRCGDAVTAWTAAELQSQRIKSHAEASTSQVNGAHSQLAGAAADVPSSVSGQSDHGPHTGAQTESPSDLHCKHARHQQPVSDMDSDSQSVLLNAQQQAYSQIPSDSMHTLYTADASQPCHAQPQSGSQTSEFRSDSLSDSNSDSCTVSPPTQGSLEGIWVYPIKSCGGIRAQEWPLGPNGLLFDREWALVGDEGNVLTQKGLPKLALIQPRVDLTQGVMQISAPGGPSTLLIPLPLPGSETTLAKDTPSSGRGDLQVRICADSVCSLQEVVSGDSQEEVKAWFQQALGTRCCLVRQYPGSRKPIVPSQTLWSGQACGQEPGGHIGFANKGQFLLMNSASLADMNTRIADQASKKKTANRCKPCAWKGVGELSRFRPNLLIGGADITAYAEDSWQKVQIGIHSFFTAGACARCEMICMDQTTAVRAGPEPLLTLATYRRHKGRILLGILLGHNPTVAPTAN